MAFRPINQYQTAVTTTASTGLAMKILGDSGLTSGIRRQIQVYVVAGGADVIIKLGTATTVTASATVASSAMADRNFIHPAGLTAIYDVEDFTHYSAITAATTATLYVTVGYGEP